MRESSIDTARQLQSHPLISVIVPVYNLEKYVSVCIRSLLNQTFDDFEVVLIDDGSTDASLEICESFSNRNENIRVFHKENGGLSSARNYGVRRAIGDYVIYVDGDDVLAPNALEDLFKLVDSEGADIACTPFLDIAEGSSLPQASGASYRVFNHEEAIAAVLHGNALTVSACGKLASRKLWESIHFPEGRVYEDLATAMAVFSQAHVVAGLENPLYGVLFRAGSITRKGRISAKQFLDYKMAISDCLDFFDMPNKTLEIALESRGMTEYARVIRLYPLIEDPDEECKAFFEYAKKYIRKTSFKNLICRQVPLNVRVKSMLAGYIPALYNLGFKIKQRRKVNE